MKKYITSMQAGQILNGVNENNMVAKLKSFLENENEQTINELLMKVLTGSEYALMDKVNKTTKVGKEYVAQFMEENKDKIILQNDPVINNILSTNDLFNFIPNSTVEFIKLPEYQLFGDIYIEEETIVVINEKQDDGSIRKIVTNIYLTSNPLDNHKSINDLSNINVNIFDKNIINCFRLKQLNPDFNKINHMIIRISKSYPYNNQLISCNYTLIHKLVIERIKFVSQSIKINYELIVNPLQKIPFNIKDRNVINIESDNIARHYVSILK